MIEKMLEKINNETFKNFLYLVLVSPYWVIAFYFFKPSFLEENYFIQGSFLFGLSFTWLLISNILLQIFEINILLKFKKLPINISKIRVEIYLFGAFVLKCIFIVIGYYLSLSFTQYLRVSYGAMLIFIAITSAIAYLQKRALQKKKQLELQQSQSQV